MPINFTVPTQGRNKGKRASNRRESPTRRSTYGRPTCPDAQPRAAATWRPPAALTVAGRAAPRHTCREVQNDYRTYAGLVGGNQPY